MKKEILFSLMPTRNAILLSAFLSLSFVSKTEPRFPKEELPLMAQ